MRPHVTIYKVADKGWRFNWNRYDEIPGHDSGVTIGAAIVMGVRCVGIQWARPVVVRREAS